MNILMSFVGYIWIFILCLNRSCDLIFTFCYCGWVILSYFHLIIVYNIVFLLWAVTTILLLLLCSCCGGYHCPLIVFKSLLYTTSMLFSVEPPVKTNCIMA